MRKAAAGLIGMATVLATAFAGAPAVASGTVALSGSFNDVTQRPRYVPQCPRGIECGSIQLNGFGAADWVYVFGPTFEPAGRCDRVDGTFTLTLRSDGSTISGPLTGLFCPGPSETGHEHAGMISYGNPFREDDVITFTDGTGQFAGLTGTATFSTFGAGARFRGTLTGTLT